MAYQQQQPQAGYQPAPPAYNPNPGYAAPPPPGYHPGYQPAQPAYPPPTAQQQSNTNVVVVQQQPQQVRTTTYVERDSPNHLLHCIITFFCPWWIFIWLIVCCIYGC